MRTAVDTSVLLDVFLADPEHGERSRDWLRAAYDAGAIIVTDYVQSSARSGGLTKVAVILGARASSPRTVLVAPLS